jgi:hypothetical protein
MIVVARISHNINGVRSNAITILHCQKQGLVESVKLVHAIFEVCENNCIRYMHSNTASLYPRLPWKQKQRKNNDTKLARLILPTLKLINPLSDPITN